MHLVLVGPRQLVVVKLAFLEDKEGVYVGYSLDLCFYGGKEV